MSYHRRRGLSGLGLTAEQIAATSTPEYIAAVAAAAAADTADAALGFTQAQQNSLAAMQSMAPAGWGYSRARYGGRILLADGSLTSDSSAFHASAPNVFDWDAATQVARFNDALARKFLIALSAAGGIVGSFETSDTAPSQAPVPLYDAAQGGAKVNVVVTAAPVAEATPVAPAAAVSNPITAPPLNVLPLTPPPAVTAVASGGLNTTIAGIPVWVLGAGALGAFFLLRRRGSA